MTARYYMGYLDSMPTLASKSKIGREGFGFVAPLFVVWLVGCGHTPTADRTDAEVSAAPVARWGECQPDGGTIPFVYVSPERGELFRGIAIASWGQRGAERIRINPISETSDRLEFTYAASKKTDAGLTEYGIVSRGEKWLISADKSIFDVENLRCAPQPSPTFYQQLSDLGIDAGTWSSNTNDDKLVIDPTSQAYTKTIKGVVAKFAYRVISRTADAVEVIVNNSDHGGDIWRGVRFSVAGKILTLAMGEFPADGWTGTFEKVGAGK